MLKNAKKAYELSDTAVDPTGRLSTNGIATELVALNLLHTNHWYYTVSIGPTKSRGTSSIVMSFSNATSMSRSRQ